MLTPRSLLGDSCITTHHRPFSPVTVHVSSSATVISCPANPFSPHPTPPPIQVLPYSLKLADGLPPLVVCIQGVNDKETRHLYAHLIEEAGGEWREPNFAAERVADILADDVSHLFEGKLSVTNQRQRRSGHRGRS